MTNEADTCRKFVVPKLQSAGWDNEPHSIAEQRTITDGRIIPVGKGFIRKPPKRVDYLLRFTRDFPLAVVEAKASYKIAADAVQQARDYAEMLGPEICLRHQRRRDHRDRLFHGHGNACRRLSPHRSTFGGAIRRAAGSTRPMRAEQPDRPFNHESAARREVLPADRHQPDGGGDPARKEAPASHHGDRHRQDHRGLPDLLEALVEPLE